MGNGSALDEVRRRVQTADQQAVESDLERAVAAQRLGVTLGTPTIRGEREETVSYRASLQLQEQLGDIVNRYLNIRHAYADPSQPRHLARDGIAMLADAGVVDREDVKIHEMAMKRLNRLLAAPELEDQAAYSLWRLDNYITGVCGLTSLGGMIATVITRNSLYIITTLLMNYAPVSLQKIADLWITGDSAKYRKAIEKHVRKHGKDMDDTIRTALDAGVRLCTQLQAGPHDIKAAYAGRAPEIEQTRSSLIEYFENQEGFFDRVRNAGKKEE